MEKLALVQASVPKSTDQLTKTIWGKFSRCEEYSETALYFGKRAVIPGTTPDYQINCHCKAGKVIIYSACGLISLTGNRLQDETLSNPILHCP